MSLWSRIFPPGPDFNDIFHKQLALAIEGVDALLKWCEAPSADLADEVFRIEREADQARRALAKALKEAFETPLDREDMDDVSRRIDDLVDRLRSTVREGMALKVTPNPPVSEVLVNVKKGLNEIQSAVLALEKDQSAAVAFASKARHSRSPNEQIYARAVAALLDGEDWREAFRQLEIYRQVIHVSECLENLADEFEHAVSKLV